ncbi:MAG: hypothetical protein ACKN9V_00550, partial [Pseudomonadota bacterium]
MNHLRSQNKKRLSAEEIVPELRPLITEIVESGTRTKEQHQALAEAVVDYLKKYGVKARIERGYQGLDIRIE